MTRALRYLLILLLASLAKPALAEDAELTATLQRLLDRGTLRSTIWGAAVRDVASGELLVDLQAQRALIPASNQKLVTMAAALLHFGPERQAKTEFYTEGPVDDGRLEGNLVVAGYGAIALTARHRDDLVLAERQRLLDEQLGWVTYQLRRRGVRHISGRLLTDCSAYTSQPENPHYPCAGPLSFHENTLDIVVADGQLRSLPDHLEAFRILRQEGAFAQQKVRQGDTLTDQIRVNLARDSIDYWRLDAMPAQSYYQRQLTWNLRARGLKIEDREMPPGERRLLLTLDGLSVAELLPAIGIHSDNFRAETLYLNLAHAIAGKADYRLGPAAIRRALVDNDLVLTSMTAADGSGLSRDNRVSAADLTTLLRHLHQSDHRELLLNSLAVAHTSGTLERRFAARGLAGKLRGKTGTINGVRAFTGLLPTRSGRLLAVSFLYNSISDADAYWKAIEAAMLELRAL